VLGAPICLVCSVYSVHLVYSVHSVYLVCLVYSVYLVRETRYQRSDVGNQKRPRRLRVKGKGNNKAQRANSEEHTANSDHRVRAKEAEKQVKGQIVKGESREMIVQSRSRQSIPGVYKFHLISHFLCRLGGDELQKTVHLLAQQNSAPANGLGYLGGLVYRLHWVRRSPGKLEIGSSVLWSSLRDLDIHAAT